MQPFQQLIARAAPLPLPQCDTDQIVPARFLWRARASGYGEQLFYDLRFDEHGQPRHDFVLNRPEYRDVQILVADSNFGCGSSRESAVWALLDYGIRAVIAPSFGDIFFNNSMKNGLLPIVLPSDRVAQLRMVCETKPAEPLHIDLPAQRVYATGGTVDAFNIDPLRKQLLLAGMDDIQYSLTLAAALTPFEAQFDQKHKWL